MFELDPTYFRSGAVTFGVVGLVIVNVFLNLYLLNKYLEQRRKNRILSQIPADPLKPVKDYIEEQFRLTKSHNSNVAGQQNRMLNKEVVALRSAYMKIERKALDQAQHSDQFWSLLNEQLLRVIRILSPQSSSRDAEMKMMEEKVALMKERISRMALKEGDENAYRFRSKALASLDEFADRYRNAQRDQNRIASYVDKMGGVVKLFEDPERRRIHVAQKRQREYAEKTGRHLDRLQESTRTSDAEIGEMETHILGTENVDVLEKELSNFKEENSRLNSYVLELKSELLQFNKRMGKMDQAAYSREVASGEGTEASPSLAELSDEILEANEQEIDRLRGVINNQRHSIVNMEESLKALESLNVGHASPEQLQSIQNLKRSMQESEMCIQMLERELEILKSDLEQLRNAVHEPHITGAESQDLAEELRNVKNELDQVLDRSQQQLHLLGFVDEALAASSVEDVSLLIYESVASLRCEPSLIIRTPERSIDLSSKGGLSAREKMVVNNMQPNEINPDGKGQLTLKLMYIAGIVRPLEEDQKPALDHQQVVQLLKIADRVVHHLIQMQKSKQTHKTLGACANQIKQASYELDKLLEGQTARSKVLLTQSIGQIQDLARAKGLGASHIAAYQSIEQEALRQIGADSTIRLKLRKRFLALLEEIEAQSR